MTSLEIFASLTDYLQLYAPLVGVVVMWVFGTACVDVIVRLVKGAYR